MHFSSKNAHQIKLLFLCMRKYNFKEGGTGQAPVLNSFLSELESLVPKELDFSYLSKKLDSSNRLSIFFKKYLYCVIMCTLCF
jgi:hypothetical protein